MISFNIEGRSFTIPSYKLPRDSMLADHASYSSVVNLDTRVFNLEGFEVIYYYLTEGKLPDAKWLPMFDYARISDHSYELAIILENGMRDNMYTDIEPYTNPYYGLIAVDEVRWSILEIDTPRDVILNSKKLTKRSWPEVITKIQLFQPLVAIPNVFVAGGAVFSALFDSPLKDIDLFIHSCDASVASQTIKAIAKTLRASGIVRTRNAVTFSGVELLDRKIDIQVVLRLYQTPSEVIHGFDVDSCCLGYDGKNILMTRRAEFAIMNGYNTVNFNRLSPSYEKRLLKYAFRGMAVKVPNFSPLRVKEDKLKEFTVNGVYYWKFNALRGLDLLLLFDYKIRNKIMNTYPTRRTLEAINRTTDYTPAQLYNLGDRVSYVLDFLLSCLSCDYYAEIKRAVKPFRSVIEKLIQDDTWQNISIVPYELKINVIKSKPEFFDTVIDIPQELYDVLDSYCTWDFEPTMTWKVTDPGEQMTNTFNVIVLKDNSEWYRGLFYDY